MKLDRLIGILALLLQRESITAPELAARFEVSRRTILRDVDALCRAGIPIASRQGAGGGFSIMDGYRVDRALLTGAEMRAILTGLRTLDSVSGTRRYAQLMEKLSAGSSSMLPGDGHILIDLASWYRGPLSEKIELIHAAIEAGRHVTFRYYAPSSESEREIEPYFLVFQWSSWYVYGWCLARRDWRLFKLNRLAELTMGEAFEKRDAPWPDLSDARVFPERWRVKALVEPQCRWRLIEEYGADCYVTGECKHSQAIEAGVMGLAVIAAGHFETENPVLIPLIEYLQANTDGVEYILSRRNTHIFRACRD